jgi:hypothetical protein
MKRTTTTATETTPAEPKRPPAYVVKIRPALRVQIRGKAVARIPVPQITEPKDVVLKEGTRLLLVEYPRTGRADLVAIMEVDVSTSAAPTCKVFRTCSWSQGRDHDDLTELNYTSVQTNAPILEALA